LSWGRYLNFSLVEKGYYLGLIRGCCVGVGGWVGEFRDQLSRRIKGVNAPDPVVSYGGFWEGLNTDVGASFFIFLF